MHTPTEIGSMYSNTKHYLYY